MLVSILMCITSSQLHINIILNYNNSLFIQNHHTDYKHAIEGIKKQENSKSRD